MKMVCMVLENKNKQRSYCVRDVKIQLYQLQDILIIISV